MINVTKTYLPPYDEYSKILKRAWDKSWITNNGELVLELEQKLKDFLQIEQLLFTNNGTIVLQMALKALGITKEVITTPFSYVATTNVILWEGCTPVFVDISEDDFCIDADKIEAAITENTQAILATHVYGFPCNVEKIDLIAKKYNLKVIYDGAHAFGVDYKGKSLLSYGDLTTCSFHATKVFHTVEGGCIISQSLEMNKKLFLMRSFGHINEVYSSVGINAKNSEFHAAMGLAILPHMQQILESRKSIINQYIKEITSAHVRVFKFDEDNIKYNYAYFPIIVSSEKVLLEITSNLEKKNIFARRYFYPSLNKLPFIQQSQSCPVSEDISQRVLCLPTYAELTEAEISQICEIINKH